MVAKMSKSSKTSGQKSTEDALEASVPPVTFFPDMTNVFQQAEAYQKEVAILSLSATKASIAELHAVSTPAIELALAALAESVCLKKDMADFFKPATS